ncbi:hypothetical protein GCM10009836_11910 [Pseudonocardia ailaonensis]|uniref:Sulfatase N-terminal domain-containing protein n=1 Tax=Pseudonocardia ailaonensis TaxID=367279 RepID=A0ABN2MQG5_9PSEU
MSDSPAADPSGSPSADPDPADPDAPTPREASDPPGTGADPDRPAVAATRPRRPWLSGTLSALAVVAVWAALVVPTRLEQLTPLAFLRIPVEGLAAAALLLLLLPRARRWIAPVLGGLLGVLLIVRALDMGFLETLVRPFDPVTDWPLLGDAYAFLVGTAGQAGAIAIAAAAALLAIALVTLLALAGARIGRLVTAHRRGSAGAVAGLAVVWTACALVGAQIVPTVPVASRSTASLAKFEAEQIPTSIRDRAVFAQQAASDAYRGVPAAQRLSGLQGKDVVLTFVESYGRSAIEDPALDAQVDQVLDAGSAELKAAGFAARSGFLTSPIAGGGSWMAHATFLSGLHIDNQERYRGLVTSDRLTLSAAFRDAGWETTAIMPGTSEAWPEGKFYGFDRPYPVDTLGYRGPAYGWSSMPDQYALHQFQDRENARPGRGPLFSEVVLTSSHQPWTAVPSMVGWDQLGDGSVFATQPPITSDLPDPQRDKVQYARSIAYSLQSLISWVRTYGDENTVLVFLGDHQPIPAVTGDGASRDVPITIVAKDPAVLDKIADWHWDDGLRPAHDAPVWPMEAFRDRFFQAFGSAHTP